MRICAFGCGRPCLLQGSYSSSAAAPPWRAPGSVHQHDYCSPPRPLTAGRPIRLGAGHSLPLSGCFCGFQINKPFVQGQRCSAPDSCRAMEAPGVAGEWQHRAPSWGAETRSSLARQKGARAAFLLPTAQMQPCRPSLSATDTESSLLCSLPGPSEETLGEREARSAGRTVRAQIRKAT